MDKLNDTKYSERGTNGTGFFKRLAASFEEARKNECTDKRHLFTDLAVFSIGFIFSRCHLLFGAYPVGLSFVSMLPKRVFPALIGCVIGALSMGENGMIFAAASAIAVFLRAIVSSGGKKGKELFSESLLLRMSVAVISGFVAAAYNALTAGLTEGGMLFGLSMVILPPTLTFVFSGIFDSSVTPEVIFSGNEDVFSLSRKDEKEKYNLIFVQISALMLIFFISLSLEKVILFGISLSSVFTVAVTLLVSKRFGALRGLATGFVSSLGVSGIYSVSYALMGLGAGVTFGFGSAYALVTGGVALSSWSIYSSGLEGFLTTFPEYLIGATVTAPLLKKIGEIRASKDMPTVNKSADEMVGTMALSYQNRYTGSVAQICATLSELGSIIKGYSERRRSENESAHQSDHTADEYELISKLLNCAILADDAERAADNTLTSALTEAISECGIEDGVIRAFGERRKHIILACEDESGKKISSDDVRQKIENAIDAKLGAPEYYRNGKLALMECGIKRRLSVEVAETSSPGSTDEVSGDSQISFETKNDKFYAILSDGMGSGDEAKETSDFVIRFLRCALETDVSKEMIMYMLNSSLKAYSEECSATVDLLEIDLLSGEGTFIKSGAAPSYVKRESSIFRIRSQTAPLGLLSTIDTERIRIDIRDGDYVVILSDGVSQTTEDAPWLLELLNEKAPSSIKDYANKILESAKERSPYKDDMSVTVIRIKSFE